VFITIFSSEVLYGIVSTIRMMVLLISSFLLGYKPIDFSGHFFCSVVRPGVQFPYPHQLFPWGYKTDLINEYNTSLYEEVPNISYLSILLIIIMFGDNIYMA